MKIFTNKNILQKIILALLIVILFNFAIPKPSYCAGWLGSSLLKELTHLIADIGDIAMGFMNKYMLGTNVFSVMLNPKTDVNVTTPGSSIYYNGDDIDETFTEAELSSNFFGQDNWKIPNMLYCPENIFANKIAALDVNFIHPNTYTDGYGNNKESFASKLAPTISSWYKAFRNIAVVGLLCVLVYLGIRILIETSVQGKAKYKESLKDWFVALCLIFAMHLIMAGTLMIIEKVTELVDQSVNSDIYIQVGDVKFKTNLTGYMRLKAQSDEWEECTGYTIIYVVLVMYTGVFTVMYLKRFLYMAFLTMISPLVALTYPLDKVGDGKAQAFNMWFKEYLMHAILQPVHLLLYTVLVSSAMSLAKENMIYALVAIGFLIPAEKLIKKMFKLDQGQTTSGFGSFAGGALTMSALNGLAKKPPIPGKDGEGKQGNNGANTDSSKIRTQSRSALGSFGGGNGDSSDSLMLSQNNGNIDNENNSIREENKNDDQEDEHFGNDNNNEINKSPTGGENSTRVPDNEINNDENSENNSGENSPLTNQNYNMSDAQLTGLEGGVPVEDTPIRFSDAMGAMGNDIKNSKIGQGVSKKYNNIADSVKYNLNETKAGRTAKAIGKTAIKGVKKQFTGENGKRKFTAAKRLVARGMGTAAGATIGLAAGIATGDMGKAFQMMGTGAMAGNSIGKNADMLVNHGAAAIARGASNFRNSYEDEKFGLVEADKKQAKRQNEKAKKAFMRNEAEQEKYRQLAIDIEKKTGKSCDVNQLMNKAFDYKVAGVDDSKITKGLMLESKHGGVGGINHEKMIDVMNFSENYGREYILDDKKRVALENDVRNKIKNNPDQQREAMNLLAEVYDLGEVYNEKSTLGKQARQAQQKTKQPKTKPPIQETFEDGSGI